MSWPSEIHLRIRKLDCVLLEVSNIFISIFGRSIKQQFFPGQQYPAGQPYPAQQYPAGQPYPAQQYPAGQPYPAQQYPAGQPYPAQQYPAGQPYPQGQQFPKPPGQEYPSAPGDPPGYYDTYGMPPTPQDLSFKEENISEWTGFSDKAIRAVFVRKVYFILMIQLLFSLAVISLFVFEYVFIWFYNYF
ncbi:hypothetical protein TNCV_11311 [Trichonephila clavipes]|nr:hypothetical protein TNCV_11311 [Trichonephila clavipes]